MSTPTSHNIAPWHLVLMPALCTSSSCVLPPAPSLPAPWDTSAHCLCLPLLPYCSRRLIQRDTRRQRDRKPSRGFGMCQDSGDERGAEVPSPLSKQPSRPPLIPTTDALLLPDLHRLRLGQENFWKWVSSVVQSQSPESLDFPHAFATTCQKGSCSQVTEQKSLLINSFPEKYPPNSSVSLSSFLCVPVPTSPWSKQKVRNGRTGQWGF